MVESKKKGGSKMTKQRLFPMTNIEQNMLVKALCNVRKESGASLPEVQGLIQKAVYAPKGKLYLSDSEFHWAAVSLNGLRTAYLSAGRSSGGIDKVLFKLMRSKYKRVPMAMER